VTVNKLCPNEPDAATDRFQVKLNGSNAGGDPLACGGTTTVSPNDDTAFQIREGAAGTTDLNNYVTSYSAGCDSSGLDRGATATCNITNTLKPKLTVTKACPNGKQSLEDRFEVVINNGRTGRILDCGASTTFVRNAGDRVTVTELAPQYPNPGSTTTNLANYTIAYTSTCNTTLAAGARVTCTITNTRRTRSQPFTPGYWKNHRSQAVALLPVMLGNYTVNNFTQVTAIFDGMNCGISTDQSAVACLAGHLLAAKLNVKNGSDNCIISWIAQGDALLIQINYIGPTGTYTLTSTQRAQFLTVKDALDRYNNAQGCT
jgi:hypothetical protein